MGRPQWNLMPGSAGSKPHGKKSAKCKVQSTKCKTMTCKRSADGGVLIWTLVTWGRFAICPCRRDYGQITNLPHVKSGHYPADVPPLFHFSPQ